MHPAKITMRKYLTPRAIYSFPKRATRGAESPDLMPITIARPKASLIICEYHFAFVSNLIYFLSIKYTGISPAVHPARVAAFFIPLAKL